MNTIESNKLIVEFDGWEHFVDMGAIQLYKRGDEVKHIGDLCYHTSWDWLMPVVEDIFNTGEEIPDELDTQWDILIKTLHQTFFFPKIEETYKAVVEFIQWYNNPAE